MMNREREKHGAGAELRALYKIAELAALTKVSRHLMERLLHGRGVLPLRLGRTVLIPSSEIQEKIPLLWKSLVASHRSRRSSEHEK
jgi:hypothetical protein